MKTGRVWLFAIAVVSLCLLTTSTPTGALANPKDAKVAPGSAVAGRSVFWQSELAIQSVVPDRRRSMPCMGGPVQEHTVESGRRSGHVEWTSGSRGADSSPAGRHPVLGTNGWLNFRFDYAASGAAEVPKCAGVNVRSLSMGPSLESGRCAKATWRTTQHA